jgi:hypothetical protein
MRIRGKDCQEENMLTPLNSSVINFTNYVLYISSLYKIKIVLKLISY